MPSRAWDYTNQPLIPSGLVIGLLDGFSLPSGWMGFNSAAGGLLCATSNDSTAGVFSNRDPVFRATSYGGAHSSGPTHPIAAEYANRTDNMSTCPDQCGEKSWDGYSSGSHMHFMVGSYTPQKNGLKLIQATTRTVPPEGGIMFGDCPNLYGQQQEDSLNTTPGMVAGTENTQHYQEAPALSFMTAHLESHSHHNAYKTRKLSGVLNGITQDIAAGSALAHTHTMGDIVVTPDMARVALRAFRILNKSGLFGLIGMWVTSDPIPPMWSVIAGWGGRYLELSSTALGETSGSGYLRTRGYTGNVSHTHAPSGISSTVRVGSAYHSSLLHAHAVNLDIPFTPDTYFVKFIRYGG